MSNEFNRCKAAYLKIMEQMEVPCNDADVDEEVTRAIKLVKKMQKVEDEDLVVEHFKNLIGELAGDARKHEQVKKIKGMLRISKR